MPHPAGTPEGPRRDAMSDGQNEQAQPLTETLWLAEERAELRTACDTEALELLDAETVVLCTVVVLLVVLWLMVVRWLNEPTNTLSASRSGSTSPVWASSSCMLSSDMLLPFFMC